MVSLAVLVMVVACDHSVFQVDNECFNLRFTNLTTATLTAAQVATLGLGLKFSPSAPTELTTRHAASAFTRFHRSLCRCVLLFVY
jgi:hypothetical protein